MTEVVRNLPSTQPSRIKHGRDQVSECHVVEPFELTDAEATAYWRDVLAVARALNAFYQPLKMNYETLGNTVPHLHTHLLPRYVEDSAPGRPFPLQPQDGSEATVNTAQLAGDAAILRGLLN